MHRGATVEMVLRLSAQRFAGPPHPGKKGGAVGWRGRGKGTVCLKEPKLRVKRPRLRKKKGQREDGEVPIAAYEAMRSAFRLPAREGMARLEKQAEWLGRSRGAGPAWRRACARAWRRCCRCGDYAWAHQAMDRWPDRVKEKCKKNKSFAIPHGLEKAEAVRG